MNGHSGDTSDHSLPLPPQASHYHPTAAQPSKTDIRIKLVSAGKAKDIKNDLAFLRKTPVVQGVGTPIISRCAIRAQFGLSDFIVRLVGNRSLIHWNATRLAEDVARSCPLKYAQNVTFMKYAPFSPFLFFCV